MNNIILNFGFNSVFSFEFAIVTVLSIVANYLCKREVFNCIVIEFKCKFFIIIIIIILLQILYSLFWSSFARFGKKFEESGLVPLLGNSSQNEEFIAI